MSIQAMAWALKQQDIKDPTQRHVLLCLANYAGEAGKGAFPSIGQLTKDTGLSESTVRRSLQDLELAGAVVKGNQALAAAYIERPDRRPTVYDIRGVTVKPREDNGVSNEPERGVKQASTGCQALTPDPKKSLRNPQSLTEVLRERMEMPKGRASTWEEEFRQRFGSAPK